MIRGITIGTFDLLHAGHIIMLEEAKTVCDYLIVLLNTDPTHDRPNKNKPVQSVLERYLQLKAVKYVDEIIPVDDEQDVYNALLVLKPDIRIIGEDYVGKRFTGDNIDIKIHYNKRGHKWSSSELRGRVNSIKD